MNETPETTKNSIGFTRGLVLFFALLYLTIYLPLMIVTYFPGWQKLNCRWHPRCKKVGLQNAYTGMDELSSFFRHQGKLVSIRWTTKEKRHLADVRKIMDALFLSAMVSVAAFILTFHRRRISRFAILNAVVILSMLAVLPVFARFWRNVFHPLLFSNQLWLNTIHDFSFYIMPRQYFKYTMVLLIVSSCGLNVLIWMGLRKKHSPGPI